MFIWLAHVATVRGLICTASECILHVLRFEMYLKLWFVLLCSSLMITDLICHINLLYREGIHFPFGRQSTLKQPLFAAATPSPFKTWGKRQSTKAEGCCFSHLSMFSLCWPLRLTMERMREQKHGKSIEWKVETKHNYTANHWQKNHVVDLGRLFVTPEVHWMYL